MSATTIAKCWNHGSAAVLPDDVLRAESKAGAASGHRLRPEPERVGVERGGSTEIADIQRQLRETGDTGKDHAAVSTGL